jgi:hypothetical protein
MSLTAAATRHRRHLLLQFGLLSLLLHCHALAGAPVEAVYAGGVIGLEALTNARNSLAYRQAGGGLYLHNSGWETLSPLQQREILTNFQNLPVALELGFKEGGDAWARHLKTGYLSLGIKPTFVAANAFDGNNHPTPEQWRAFSDALRAAGLPAATLILPTFEYANFGPNLATLSANTVNRRRDFQAIIRAAGGLVLDSPPGYAFQREPAYRDWILDAIHWARKRRLTVVWITSPHVFHDRFRADTDKFLDFLTRQGALPSIIVVENYDGGHPEHYENVVGCEALPQSTVGVAYHLLTRNQK